MVFSRAFASRLRSLSSSDKPSVGISRAARGAEVPLLSGREIAWEMKVRMDEVEPELGRLIQATPPWVEDPLRR